MSAGDEIGRPTVDGGATPEPARTPEEIRAEIEQTREQLGETVEALAEKTDVKAQAQDRIAAVKETVAEKTGTVKETVAEKTGTVKETMAEKAGTVKDTVAGGRDEFVDRRDQFVHRAREATPESASVGAQQVTAAVREKPLPYATAGAFAAGMLAGWLLGRR